MAVPNYFMTFEPFETWEGFYQPVERQDAPPELRQQVQLQSVGTVGKSLLRLVMDFHEQPVHPDRGRRSGLRLDKLRLAAVSAAGARRQLDAVRCIVDYGPAEGPQYRHSLHIPDHSMVP